MMQRQNMSVRQGDTFRRVVRWEQAPYIYKPITAIARSAPARVTSPSHGLVSGWRAAVVSVVGMDEINAQHSPPYDSEMVQVTKVDPDNVDLNVINAAGFSAYKSGGYLQFYTPVDLTGYTARMQIRDPATDELLFEMTTEDGGIDIDAVENTITLLIAAADVQAFSWLRGVYDLEMISPLGIHETIYTGSFLVTTDIERPV
jgi:hypothetical protein